ncbi:MULTISPECIES: lysozyme inhibitor LprI family protein [unclassified Pseudomonas]|uniref:lysozyme inhibitor LprI family protein n=1 Tax=unclassified Pseudomonas TaxID=196821 RepID=UPI0025E3A26D|nr:MULTISPECIES: lysozyme inhibitor LprI family protein [unclassified Pseudomonas]
MRKISIALLTVLFPLGVQAAGCAQPRNAFDQVYCVSNLFSQADRDLNQEYTALRKHLNPTQQSALKAGQVAWIKQRDNDCSEEKSSGYFVNLACAVETTQQRMAFLQERERECTSTGCVDSKLGQ